VKRLRELRDPPLNSVVIPEKKPYKTAQFYINMPIICDITDVTRDFSHLKAHHVKDHM